MEQLIASRGLPGGGMMNGVLFAILGDIFSPRERGHYQGVLAALWGVSSMFGPTLRDWLTDH